MGNKPSVKSPATFLVLALVYATAPAAVAAQSTGKSPPFGASLKRPRAEAGREAPGREGSEAAAAASPQPEEVLRVNTSLVDLDVLITDAEGSRFITGLTRDDFVITEDDRPQPISSVTAGDDAERLPRSIILIFDRSQSELPYLDSSVEAAKKLVDQLARPDETAIVTDDVELAAGFTTDEGRLRHTLDSLKKLTPGGYQTRSMQFSARPAALRELIDADRRRPIIIFQSDGDEVSRLDYSSGQNVPSGYDMSTVYSEVERSRAKNYAVIPNVRLIGVPEEEIGGRLRLAAERVRLARARNKDMWYGMERVPPAKDSSSSVAPPPPLSAPGLFERNAQAAIKGQTAAARVADLSGGWTSFLERPEQAGEIYSRIIAEISRSYVISYYPTNQARDGRLRRVRVEVRGHPDYVVRGRTSYYAAPR